MNSIITRGDLPHWFMPGAFHFVTFRLADTFPKEVRDRLIERRKSLLGAPPSENISIGDHRAKIHKTLFVEYESYLDKAEFGDRWLSDPRIASLVRTSLHYLHGKKYWLLAYCIMSNHVHMLIQPLAGVDDRPAHCTVGEDEDAASPLSSIMHSLKSYTAHAANKILGRSGPFWQHESYDHWVRDHDELEKIVKYINLNAVKAGLVKRPIDWFWGSAHERYLTDGDTSGWLKV